MELADKLKMALDEGRLLILGAQVVFGCQFQMVFQERFQDAPRDSQAVQGIGLLALMLTVALLITPSMTHQMAYRGEDRNGALRVASTCAGLAMVPMTLGLAATTFVVFESLFNRNVGVLAGITFAHRRIFLPLCAWPCSQDRTQGSDASVRKTNSTEDQDRAIADRGQGHHSWRSGPAGIPWLRDALERNPYASKREKFPHFSSNHMILLDLFQSS